MQARWGTHGDHPIVALAPASVLETYVLTAKAFAIADQLRIPVILLTDEITGHMRERVILPEPEDLPHGERPQGDPAGNGASAGVPPMHHFGDGHRLLVTGLYHDESGFWTESPQAADGMIRRLTDKVERRRQALTLVDRWYLDDARVAVVAYGCVSRSALRAVRMARSCGRRVGMLRPACLWPFPDHEIEAIAGAVETIVVPEMNLGQIAGEVERAAAGRCRVIRYNRVDSELIRPDELLPILEDA
jgi:2-oxoglutarate ferredoxin oxidoreductase subunit alpha